MLVQIGNSPKENPTTTPTYSRPSVWLRAWWPASPFPIALPLPPKRSVHPVVGPSAPTGGPFLSTQTDRLEFALMRFSNLARAEAGRRVPIAHVVGATRSLGGGGDRDPARNYPCVDRLSTPNRPAWKNRRGEKCAQRARRPRQGRRPKHPCRSRAVHSHSLRSAARFNLVQNLVGSARRPG